MVSRPSNAALRKPPEERRAEIVAGAAQIALNESLEHITLRAVADRLGVRPGLISHYFPAVETLVVEALASVLSRERDEHFPESGSALARLSRLAAQASSDESLQFARLWLNARHLARFRPLIAAELEEQERLGRDRLIALLEDGVRAGEFSVADPRSAAVRILIANDGYGAYANNPEPFLEESFTNFVADAIEWALGLEPGALKNAEHASDAPDSVDSVESP